MINIEILCIFIWLKYCYTKQNTQKLQEFVYFVKRDEKILCN